VIEVKLRQDIRRIERVTFSRNYGLFAQTIEARLLASSFSFNAFIRVIFS